LGSDFRPWWRTGFLFLATTKKKTS